MSIRKTTIIGIAKLAGVSHATVSYVLNDQWRAKRISAKLAERVRQIAVQQNYRPNRLIHALKSGHTHTLALILPDVSTAYFPRIASGVETEARRHGYHMLISQVQHGLEDEVAEIEMLLERRVDGLILVPRYGEHNRTYYRRLVAQGIPLVSIDSYYPDVPCPAIVGSDEEGMRLATRHLIALGHRRIAYQKLDLPEVVHMQDRFRGFCRTMADQGLAIPDEYCIGETSEAVATLLRRPNRPTALIAANDYLALDTMRAAEAMGLRVPEDLAVVGFSDCLMNVDWFRVPLTSVRMDLDAMGRLAVQQFLHEVEAGVSGRHATTRVAAELVVRASCGRGPQDSCRKQAKRR